MSAGSALDDSDREPWLLAIREAMLAEAAGAGDSDEDGGVVVVACSALKRSYRDILRGQGSDDDAGVGTLIVVFAHLEITEEESKARVAARESHFMPESLVRSQFVALEALQDDELGSSVDGTLEPATLAETVCEIFYAAITPPS